MIGQSNTLVSRFIVGKVEPSNIPLHPKETVKKIQSIQNPLTNCMHISNLFTVLGVVSFLILLPMTVFYPITFLLFLPISIATLLTGVILLGT